jgi:hypothetical protein
MTSAQPVLDRRYRQLALGVILAVMAYRSGRLWLLTMGVEPLGADFSCLWAGARVALSDPARIYDFRFVTAYQGWPLGPQIRPFIYPPSALLLLLPVGLLPLSAAYTAFTTATGALFFGASQRAGAPWWVVLFPVVTLVAACGQVTFLVAALVLFGLVLRNRQVLAGVLFAIAAAIKPQLLVLLPLGLLADRRWITLAAAAVTGLALCGLSAALWGWRIWFEWFGAVQRFQQEVVPAIPGLRESELTPFAVLELNGVPGALVFLLAPAALLIVWRTFRATDDALVRASAALGCALLISPYAMPYDAGVLAPGVAALLAKRSEKHWPAYVAAAMTFAVFPVPGQVALLAGLAPLVVRKTRREGLATADRSPQRRVAIRPL